MTPFRPLCGFALAVLILGGGLMSPQSAKAEDLVDFLWGGSDEYGGGRSIVSFDPQYKPNQIIVSFSDRRLYLITRPGQAITYPVAVPMGEARWQGVTFVSDKKVNPAWTPTPEMVRQNPRLPRWVPGGHPMNPLGIRAMYLGSSAYRIHGTDAPWTIGQAVSHGCIRMINEDVLDLYPRVPVGMRVTVTWQHFSTNAVASNDPSYATYGSSASSGSTNSASADAGNSGGSYGPYGKNSSSYGAYGSNSSTPSPSSANAPSRTASNRPADGSISSLFFWDDDAAPKPTAEPAAGPAPAAAAAGSVTPATAAPKKKTATASVTKKKPDSEGTAAPSFAHAVPDPVKPHFSTPADPAATKASEKASAPELTPAATKASASATEDVPVQKANAQVQ